MTIKQRYSRELAEVIAKAKARWSRESLTTAGGVEIYAYPHPAGITWGINAAETGVNISRGIRRPDGADEAEGLTTKLEQEERPRRISESWRTSQQSRLKSGAC